MIFVVLVPPGFLFWWCVISAFNDSVTKTSIDYDIEDIRKRRHEDAERRAKRRHVNQQSRHWIYEGSPLRSLWHPLFEYHRKKRRREERLHKLLETAQTIAVCAMCLMGIPVVLLAVYSLLNPVGGFMIILIAIHAIGAALRITPWPIG
ncbi:hypothetical protein [Bradyrhizobium sp. dw_78]|uniref:hypothetical protein n=1 Tax=Bradyrhizobium sp. dw_78 TaxID=2719793 RepID=UPI001BD3476A|nr:hypothetical protein [Bradyrhizobium sp. dw_78]